MEALIEIKGMNLSVKNVELPPYFAEITSQYDYFVEVKRHLSDVFMEFYHSDTFKETDNTDGIRVFHFHLNEMLDNLFVAQQQERQNTIKTCIAQQQERNN
ncbi:MAG: hypothetical protein H7339_01045 [Arcicella sp.]|nr:hypothetical protein [Arcicella sp.]